MFRNASRLLATCTRALRRAIEQSFDDGAWQ
jgi:hypothetical protein